MTSAPPRHSVRGFRPDPLPRDALEGLFAAAQRAPSWCNIQPWRAWVSSGDAASRLRAKLLEAASKGAPQPEIDFPAEYPEPYGALRRQCGASLYSAMGIARDDKPARYGAWMRNYAAFDAPTIAIVGFDRRFGIYGALDVGCWLQSLVLAATSEGLSTCAQASLSGYPSLVREHFAIPAEVAIVFGIAIGYEAKDVPANACRTDRQPLELNVTFAE